MSQRLSPQGYNLNKAPFNTNPFWKEEIDGAIKSLSMTKETEGDFDNYTWTYVDTDGAEHIFATQRVSNKAGEDGVTFTPNITSYGTLTWTNDGGLPNPPAINIKGQKGDTGEKGDTGAKGDPGQKGEKGERGERGIPGADGLPGPTGQPGIPGTPGANGADGVSPTITITNISDGYRLTIIDIDGTRSIDVINGKDGKDGQDGAQGPAGPSDVNPLLTEGVKIARINGQDIYAPQGGSGGATSYAELTDKPSIEGVTLEGDSTFEDLGIASAEDLAQTNEDLIEVTQTANSASTTATQANETANAANTAASNANTALNGFGFDTQDGKDGYTHNGTFTPFAAGGGGGGGSVATSIRQTISNIYHAGSLRHTVNLPIPNGIDPTKILSIGVELGLIEVSNHAISRYASAVIPVFHDMNYNEEATARSVYHANGTTYFVDVLLKPYVNDNTLSLYVDIPTTVLSKADGTNYVSTTDLYYWAGDPDDADMRIDNINYVINYLA